MANDKNDWTRRQFFLSLGAAAIAAGCESKRPASEARRFPSTFRWGCGSSAFQVEGALDVDGRGESIWDTFAKQNGRIKDGSIPSMTCNSYYRYKEDAALMSAAAEDLWPTNLRNSARSAVPIRASMSRRFCE